MAPSAFITAITVEETKGDRIREILNVADAADITTTPADEFAKAIDSANDYIDQAIRRRYDPAVIVLSVPPAIVHHGVNLCVYYLMVNFRPALVTDGDTDLRREAESYFGKLASGALALDQPVSNLQSAVGTPSAKRIGEDAVNSAGESPDFQTSEQAWFKYL